MTESVRSTKASVVVMPSAFRVKVKAARMSIAPAVTIHVMRGLLPMLPARRDQMPDSRSSSSPSRGTLGQKAQRPGGNLSREKGPHCGLRTRMIPKTTQPTMVIMARIPPRAAKGPTEMSVTKLSPSPMTVGTRKARIGRTMLGITSRAGRNVSITTRAPTMPAAPTGPSDLFELSSLSIRHSSPMMTVAALATIGSTTPRHAAFIASVCRVWWCSSSRYRATINRA